MCGCTMCKTCLREHVTVAMMSSSSSTWPHTCPVCEIELHPLDIRRSCSRRTARKVDRMSLATVARQDPTLRMCPFSNCSHIHSRPASQPKRRYRRHGPRNPQHACPFPCPKCRQTSCDTCGSPIRACSCPGNNQRRPTPHPTFMNAGLAVRGCPNCGAPTHKASGCPRVKCGACDTSWDWDAGDSLTQAVRQYTGRPRSKWEWCRMGILAAMALGCGGLAGTMYTKQDWMYTWAAVDATVFLVAECMSRGRSLFSSHTCLIAVFLGFGTMVNVVGTHAVVPSVTASLDAAAAFVGWNWVSTAARWAGNALSFTTWSMTGACYGLCTVLAAAEWCRPLYRQLVRL